MAGELAAAGLRVLLLERGGPMAPEEQNIAAASLFGSTRYHPSEPWLGTDGDPFAPQMVYALGGNTKIWGGVLQRMREDDFTGGPLEEGPGPDWQLRYADLEPWYEKAEALYRVHGHGGVDPSEPPRRDDYLHPPLPIEPFLEEIRSGLERLSLHPYALPLSWSLSQDDPSGDAERFGLDRAAAGPGYILRCGACVTQLHVNPSGTEVRGVEAEIDGQRWLFRADQVVLAAGAVNSAVILLRSSSDSHPDGLANGSGQVGRNLMKPQLTAILQRAGRPTTGRSPRCLGIADYYWGDRNVSYGLGSIQGGGDVRQDPLFAESPPVLSLVSRLLPEAMIERLASRSICWWAMSAVRPDAENRVTLRGERLSINYLPNCREAHDRLVYRWLATIEALEADPLTTVVPPAPIHPRGEAPLAVMGYACGTCRMGSDPQTSVVDLEGRCHQVANLSIADASILPGCPAVGVGLTVIANALRIAERLKQTQRGVPDLPA
jgi:choline dehydrogenase-like flavoprotein